MNAKDAWLKQVKYNRKKKKGLPYVGFNPNAGNVEHNIKMFNHMNDIGDLSNNPISGPFGGDVSAPAGDGAGMSMGESLNEALKTDTPYMLRNDGRVFELDNIHPYIISDKSMPIDRSLYALIMHNPEDLIWFYNNTNQPELREMIKALTVQCYENYQYYRLTIEQITNLANIFNTDLSDRLISEYPKQNKSLELCLVNINNATNQEFCRFRTSHLFIGGRSNSKDIYFRISSHNFNWFNLIWALVYENKNYIESVTIEADQQSKNTAYIYKHNGEAFDHIKTEDFININGNPIVESIETIHPVAKKLQEGVEYFKAFRMNLGCATSLNDYLYEEYLRNNFIKKEVNPFNDIDESLETGSAYMLKNTGELFKCDLIHPYLKANHQSNNYDSIRELFLVHPDDLVWVYNHIEDQDTKNLIKQIIKSVKANAEYYGIWYSEIFDDLEKSIDLNDIPAIDNSNDIEVLLELANQKVNQDFCRVRTSNVITSGASRDIYFRIGSHGFNWFDLIWNLVYENRKWISSVTIVGDKQSRGESFVYSHNGEKIEEMKTDDFINISGRPVFEKFDLQHGYRLNEFYKKINPIHIISRNRLNYFDYIHENYIRSSRDYSDKFSSNSSVDSRDDNLFKYLNRLEDI